MKKKKRKNRKNIVYYHSEEDVNHFACIVRLKPDDAYEKWIYHNDRFGEDGHWKKFYNEGDFRQGEDQHYKRISKAKAEEIMFVNAL